MVSGFWGTGSIPNRDAHIYTLSENSVTIICLALRRSAEGSDTIDFFVRDLESFVT